MYSSRRSSFQGAEGSKRCSWRIDGRLLSIRLFQSLRRPLGFFEGSSLNQNKTSQPLKMIGRAATIVRPVRRITILEDTPDNRVLECAVTAEADLIVTGDDDLLKLRAFEGIPIVRLADFLRSVPAEDGSE